MLSDPHADKRGNIEMCQTCRFFFPTPKCHETGIGSGDCRRMPPVASVEGHPTTYPQSWCGEFQEDKLKVDYIKAQEK